MKATIERINRYKITINGKSFVGFSKRAEWNGLIKFTGPYGALIVDTDVGVLEEHEPVEMTVVKASPGLIA